MGISVLNLDGQAGLAPFETVSLLIEALAWCTMLVLIGVETKVYISDFRWFVRFGVIYALVGDAVMFNLVLSMKDFYNRFQKCWAEELQKPKPWLLRALNYSLGGRTEAGSLESSK